jgi:cation diffusion facilitator CzcD-associated flavoprotein CzcO
VKQTNTLIIGASISGLACAAALQRQGIDYTLIEKEQQIAMPWRNHYERLHLHTNKASSNLPYKKFDRAIPRYPSRQQVVNYLEDYREFFNINPVFNTAALSVKQAGDHWLTETANGTFQSKYVIMATGAYGTPGPIDFAGIETFGGTILHSSRYKTGRDFKGKQVLVVGFGNSACEIAIDLWEQGALPAMSVRSAVNVVPRDILGIPVLQLSLLLNHLPPRIADAISAPLIKWILGDITKLGLAKMPYGPLEQISRDARAPVLDIGTRQHIRDGHINIYGGIDYIKGNSVHFTNGQAASFDAIVAAIGYSNNTAAIVTAGNNRFEDLKVCAKKQQYFGKDGLYFCGYWISPTGQIREIAMDARRIAKHIAASLINAAI